MHEPDRRKEFDLREVPLREDRGCAGCQEAPSLRGLPLVEVNSSAYKGKTVAGEPAPGAHPLIQTIVPVEHALDHAPPNPRIYLQVAAEELVSETAYGLKYDIHPADMTEKMRRPRGTRPEVPNAEWEEW